MDQELDLELERQLERAPDLEFVEQSPNPYRVISAFVGEEVHMADRWVMLRDLIDPETGDFYTIVRLDEHPLKIIRATVNVANRTIRLSLERVFKMEKPA